MKRILLLSDTHSYWDQAMLKSAKEADELWHAGDWGDLEFYDQLPEDLIVRGVYGNIDGLEVRKCFSKELYFEVEQVKVYMTHIGGYPGRLQREVKTKLIDYKPDLYICGHSHILKVVRDKSMQLLHMNPGAIGNKGFHKKRTMLRFTLDKGEINELSLIEYEKNFA